LLQYSQVDAVAHDSESSIKGSNKGDDCQPAVCQDQAQPVVISSSHQQLSFPFTCGAPYQVSGANEPQKLSPLRTIVYTARTMHKSQQSD